MEVVEPRHVNISSSLRTPLVLNHRDLIKNNTKQADDHEVEELADHETYHYHANKEAGTSTFFKTCFNGVNALSGIGILSMPYALASGGWLSLILLFIVASATFYTGLLIRRCIQVNSKIRTYPDIGEHAFGHKGRTIISIFMCLELYLVVTGFLILEGDNLSNLFPNMGFELAGIRICGREGFVIIVALIILPSMYLNDLSKLSYISATGVLASILIICSVLWVGVGGGTGFHEKGKLLNLNGIPTAVSLYAFSYCAHPVFPTLYTSMSDKRQFSKVLLLCFVLTTISYAFMAVLGYLMYGENVKSQVTLNLPHELLGSKIAIYTTLVTPIAKYALTVTPVVSAIENSVMFYYNNRAVSLLCHCFDYFAIVMLPEDHGNVSEMWVRVGDYHWDYFDGFLSCNYGSALSIVASFPLPHFLPLQHRWNTLDKVGDEHKVDDDAIEEVVVIEDSQVKLTKEIIQWRLKKSHTKNAYLYVRHQPYRECSTGVVEGDNVGGGKRRQWIEQICAGVVDRGNGEGGKRRNGESRSVASPMTREYNCSKGIEPRDANISLTTPLVSNHGDLLENTKQVDDEERADYPNKEGTSTFFKTCFNGLNALSGVGILSIPYALASGGWLSLTLLFIVASATFYTGLLMRRCLQVNSKIRTYPDIGEHAFGHKGRTIVSIFMCLELYLVATGFLILEGDNLSNLFPNIGLELAGIRIYGREGFVIIVALVILPSMWLNDLSKVSYISATGVLASILIICSVLWVGAAGGIGFHEKGKLLNLNGIPTGVSLYAFCYCAHPVFPTLYTSMRDKRQFSKVLLLCFVLSTLSLAFMAVLGYLMYGENVKSQVTLNLPHELLGSKIAIYTTLVTPIAKYALTVTPVVSAIENSLMFYYNNRAVSLLVRTMLLISSVIVALTVPFFEYLMALVGAFLSATVSIILPSLCYLKITGTYRRWGYELVIIIGIILMGISVVIIGTYTSLQQIAGELHTHV
ncbi:Amino acid transporter [Macleaya cordata]|uniref:Amino acid transporter n=1 Tax=Macleaya cordata TaxID=56857 RepID=A0A200QES2_MACCD|nr:Amino acid transporter [Macleaya cordata]